MSEPEGGYLIPETAYIDVVKDGEFWRAVRWVGWQFVKFGAMVKSFGYTKKEIHPHADLMEAIRKCKVVK